MQAASNVLHVAGTVLEVVVTTAIANVLVGALGGLAFDAIFQAITSSTEQEESIKHLEIACENFIPGSERYRDTIYEVLAEAKIHKQVAALDSD